MLSLVFAVIALFAAHFDGRPSPQRADADQYGPVRATVCQIKNDPKAYNHKLVEVTGFVSHAFENFAIADPDCSTYPNIWLEYGGTVKSGTMYCCGVTADRNRPSELRVENIPIPLVTDQQFHDFEKAIQPPFRSGSHGAVIRATLVGRFFSGEQTRYPAGEFWGGYGHMGCCSLLAIQQVKAVDTDARLDLDYGAEPDQPNIVKSGCGYTQLLPIERTNALIQWQKEADGGKHTWAFDDHRRVALELLSGLTNVHGTELSKMTLVREAQGREVYEWSPASGRQQVYMVVVSRPYVSSFYARDRKRVAWVATAAYRSSCNAHDSVTRID